MYSHRGGDSGMIAQQSLRTRQYARYGRLQMHIVVTVQGLHELSVTLFGNAIMFAFDCWSKTSHHSLARLPGFFCVSL